MIRRSLELVCVNPVFRAGDHHPHHQASPDLLEGGKSCQRCKGSHNLTAFRNRLSKEITVLCGGCAEHVSEELEATRRTRQATFEELI